MNQESRKTGKELQRLAKSRSKSLRAAIAVHRNLDRVFWNRFTRKRSRLNLRFSGIQFIRQNPVPLFYRDHQIGEHRLDFLVEGKIVVELKAISHMEDIHFAIGRSYLKATES